MTFHAKRQNVLGFEHLEMGKLGFVSLLPASGYQFCHFRVSGKSPMLMIESLLDGGLFGLQVVVVGSSGTATFLEFLDEGLML